MNTLTTTIFAEESDRLSSTLAALIHPQADWPQRLQTRMQASVHAPQESLGHLEEGLTKEVKEFQRRALEAAAQAKADAEPPCCPRCERRLMRCSLEARHIETKFGDITLSRLRGWCPACQKWMFPADIRLGLEDTAGYSPSVQEAAALLVSKMPVADASAVLERLTGLRIPPSTLDREARRQGKRAVRTRATMDAATIPLSRERPPKRPVTLIIEADAWHIRERDDWGQSEKLRKQGLEPERWHWAYAGTCFQLDQRRKSASGRPVILSRGFVMTRGGRDAFATQLKAEARRHGLDSAADVLVLADGAAWIWNLADECFPHGRQRLDAYHAKEHLWAVASALHGAGTDKARAWIQPYLNYLDKGQPVKLVKALDVALSTAEETAQREALRKERDYFNNHCHRMDYTTARKRKEPSGSGAIEATCRQYQCRFKRTGQFWSTYGDEALFALETFWRNGQWKRLFPHLGDSTA